MSSLMLDLYSCISDLYPTLPEKKSCCTTAFSIGTTVVTGVPGEKPLLGGYCWAPKNPGIKPLAVKLNIIMASPLLVFIYLGVCSFVLLPFP